MRDERQMRRSQRTSKTAVYDPATLSEKYTATKSRTATCLTVAEIQTGFDQAGINAAFFAKRRARVDSSRTACTRPSRRASVPSADAAAIPGTTGLWHQVRMQAVQVTLDCVQCARKACFYQIVERY